MTRRRVASIDLYDLEWEMRRALGPVLDLEKSGALELFTLFLWHLQGKGPMNFRPVVLSPRYSRALLESGYAKIAAIVMKTYVGLGDDALLADDQALELIRDVLQSIDSRFPAANRHRRVVRRRSRIRRRRSTS
jgi:hypothetical protein